MSAPVSAAVPEPGSEPVSEPVSEIRAAAADETVLLLHGLWMNRLAMGWLGRTTRRAGFATRALTYRSVRAPLAAHLAQVSSYIEGLPGRRIHLVAHSLGGVIALRYLQGNPGQPPDPRIGRCVLLGAPVAGCSSALAFARRPGGRWMLGQSFELWHGRFDTALDARYEVGAIAGTVPLGLGRLFARAPLPGDGVVGVEETRMPGLRDHLVMQINHSGMLISPTVARAVVTFLREGRFRP
jgi:pimeloyl-ACP methyl ester carboxylesterase